MSQIPRSVRQFMDIEAGVDNGSGTPGSEDEDEEWDRENFFDDRSLDQGTHVSWRDLPDREDGLGELLTGILERSRRAAQRHAPATDDNNTPMNYTATLVAEVARAPGPHDYPLWRVRCRLGMEQELVFFLMQTALPRHQLRSAFMRNSIHGWVYLETTMNKDLVQHLLLSPGVVRLNAAIIREQVDFQDWTKVLSQHDSAPNSNLAVGDWVRVLKGTYKGDIGYVAAVENWGGVSLLLVPRLPASSYFDSSLSKRKRSRSTTPCLFDPLAAKRDFGVDPVQQKPHVYRFNGYTFEFGLILKAFDLRSVSSTSAYIPSQLFFLYRSAGHPTLATSTFPRPLEWHFAKGEKVMDRQSRRICLIHAVGDIFAEVGYVYFEEGIGTEGRIPLSNLLKEFHPGDFVEVMGGPFLGQSGWVEGGSDDIIHIAVESRPDDPTEVRDVKSIEVHVNCLKAATVPFLHAQPSSGSEKQPWNDPIPWIGTTVLVSKLGHPMKGYQGIVKSVLCNQLTESGLRVVAQLTHLDPFSPYKTVVLDYDDVVEARFRCKLFDFRMPLSKLFIPLNQDHTKIQIPARSSPSSSEAQQRSAPSSSGNMTPMPDWSPSSSTPAWDPSSRTPMPTLSTPSRTPPSSLMASHDPTPTTATSSSSIHPALPQHPLLDSRLLGVQLKVIVNGGHFKDKEAAVTVEMGVGRLVIRHKVYKTSQSLDPAWVSPKHPHPTRDNGLFVVIKGEHCGKYVRRIHHKYDQETVIIILGVVKRTENSVDSLTGEQLELGADHLCEAIETKEDKQRNKTVMTALREQARKIRPK